MYEVPLVAWAGFLAFILAMLAIDLGVFHRRAHVVSVREAAVWSAVWVALALIFNGLVYLWRGPEAGLEFATGYLIEKSLSVDNLFVFVLLFTAFKVPEKLQHRVLFWGILGALVMRGALIGVGSLLIERFHWVLYVFGAFLVVTGIKMLVLRQREMDPEKNPLLRLLGRVLPIAKDYQGEAFWIRREGKLLFTPLFLVLVLVEATDLVFAVDSIPAIFAITEDPFLVFTSNVFAILGLRSLYFLLAGAVAKFTYLKPALALILTFVGVKMTMIDVFKVPAGISLGVIAGLLGLALLASWWRNRQQASRAPQLVDQP
ncbi:MAG: TerC family protein [Thermoanaerobaculia bacterium]